MKTYRCFDSYWFSLAVKVTTGTHNFVSFIVKIVLSESLLTLSAPTAAETHCFVYLSFNSTLQLINGISSDLQKLVNYFNVTALVVFFRISFAPSGLAFFNNLAWCLKHLKPTS